MRRTTSRSSTRSSARRASSSRSKRSKRATRPRLNARQVREILGVLLMLAALLGLLAILSHAGLILGGIRDGIESAFGRAWFVPVIAAVSLSAWLLWTKAPRPRTVDVVAGLVAVLSLVGLFSLVSLHAGGSVGDGVDDALTSLFTGGGTWALLVAGLVIGLIVTIHFSPGALLVTAVGALRAANAERARLRDLVATPAPEKTRPAKPVPSSDALTRSAASFATAPAAADQKKPWETAEAEGPEPKAPQHEPSAAAVADEPADNQASVLRVPPEPEDDLPGNEWQLPSIALLDPVTAA